ncbi:MAG: response regulator [Chitinophagales bacterium]|nr:response regulator [Chitinophagales bacterium]
MMTSKKNRIILIDDSPAEPILLGSAIDKSGRSILLESFDDSVYAVKELVRRSKEDKDLMPNLILLDLNMPGYSGIEVLKKLRKDKVCCFTPIIVMTSSSLDSDVVEAIREGAKCVIVKPTGHKKYIEVVQKTFDFWFETAKCIGNEC